MDFIYGLPLVAVLLYVLHVARRITRRERLRRYQLRRSLNRGSDIRTSKGPASARSEMRAYGDPTTVIDQITKTSPPVEGGKPASGAPQTGGRDTTRSRTKHKRRY